MATRGVICEGIERKKGNLKEGSLNETYKHIQVLDCTGITLGHMSADVRRVIKQVIIEMGNIYPDTVYKLMFVNAPFIFRAVWAMVSPFVDKATLKKVQILGSGSG